MKALKAGLAIVAGLALAAGVALAFAPFIFADLFRIMPLLHIRPTPPPTIAGGTPTGPALGMVVDGYWRVQQIGPGAWAIGEPQGDPDNYEYLLVGQARALLIDAGSTARDIHPALRTVTGLPVTVIPTHLHFDHTDGLRNFEDIALVDLPETRARVRGDGRVHLGHYEYLGGPGTRPPLFRVGEWVRPGGWIDLGGRRVQVLWTPGHTATSISLLDPAAERLFTGDLIYPTSLYAFQPDSSLSAYAATIDRLLAILPAGTVIYGAHCCRNDVPPQAPWLGLDDLRDVGRAVRNVEAGRASGVGFFLRRYPVNARMTLLTLYPLGNR
jgi:hydroxyacylglutathione hydrolase